MPAKKMPWPGHGRRSKAIQESAGGLDQLALRSVLLAMFATIARQDFSQSRSDLVAAFISAESNLPTSATVALQASAHALHEAAISGLCLAIMLAERLQNAAQSEAR